MLLHCESPEPPMSQLGQEHRFWRWPAASALPPISTKFRTIRQVGEVPIGGLETVKHSAPGY